MSTLQAHGTSSGAREAEEDKSTGNIINLDIVTQTMNTLPAQKCRNFGGNEPAGHTGCIKALDTYML